MNPNIFSVQDADAEELKRTRRRDGEETVWVRHRGVQRSFDPNIRSNFTFDIYF